MGVGDWELKLGLFDRLRDGLSHTKQQIVSRFDEIVQQADASRSIARPVDVDTIEALEELLMSADVGIAATERIVAAVKAGAVAARACAIWSRTRSGASSTPSPAPPSNGHRPHVTLIVGVNGTGKTTTVGKLANLLKQEGHQPLICAADTFRAAAVEQLEIWAKRAERRHRSRQGRVRPRGGGVRRDSVGQGERPRIRF